MHHILRRILRFSHEVIFPRQLAFGVFFLQLFGDRQRCKQLKIRLQDCPEGSVGCELLRLMERHGIHFVPWYERHDLKHLLLGYRLEACDEMRMQAFMFGNAGFSPFITLATLTFLLWVPDAWRDLPRHYFIGKMTRPIGGLNVEQVAHRNLEELRRELGLEDAKAQVALFFDALHGRNWNPGVMHHFEKTTAKM